MDPKIYEQHERLEAEHWWFRSKNRLIAHAATKLARRGGRAVDIGCGTGGLLSLLGNTFRVQGIELEPIGREVCKRRGLDVQDGCLPDGLPLKRGEFDLVVASDVVEHVEDDFGAVKALAELLAPDGVLIVTVPAYMWMWGKHDELNHHKRRYTTTTLGSLVRATNLRIEMLSYRMISLFPLMALSRVLFPSGSPGLHVPPKPVNTTLEALFAAERFLPQGFPAPFGGSVWCIARRAGQTQAK